MGYTHCAQEVMAIVDRYFQALEAGELEGLRIVEYTGQKFREENFSEEQVSEVIAAMDYEIDQEIKVKHNHYWQQKLITRGCDLWRLPPVYRRRMLQEIDQLYG